MPIGDVRGIAVDPTAPLTVYAAAFGGVLLRAIAVAPSASSTVGKPLKRITLPAYIG